MSDYSKLAHARKKLADIEEAIIIQNNLCKKEPHSFAYSLAMKGLKARRDELQKAVSELMFERNYEYIDVILDGQGIIGSSAPIYLLGRTLIGFQKMINSIAQTLHSGPTSKGKISQEILNLSELRISTVFSGSFGVKLYGKSSPVLFGESILTRSIDIFFKLLEAKDNYQQIMSIIGALGPRTLGHYRALLHQITESKVAIKTKWIDLDNNERLWIGDSTNTSRVSLMLSHIEKHLSMVYNYEGWLLGASLIKNSFEFIRKDTGEKITGSLTDRAREVVQHFFGLECIAKIEKNVFRNNITNEFKTNWVLLNLSKAEPRRTQDGDAF